LDTLARPNLIAAQQIALEHQQVIVTKKQKKAEMKSIQKRTITVHVDLKVLLIIVG
jgi:hypothetical protein